IRQRRAGVVGRERSRPPAWQQQEPRADRPVGAGEPQIGPRPWGSVAVDPVAGRIRDASGRAHRARGLPLSESKVPAPVVVVSGAGMGRMPRASPSPGPRFGSPPPPAPAAQTLSLVSTVLAWLPLVMAT